MILAIFFLVGLIVGSFLNVVVYRLRLADTILGRSRCQHCANQISWYDNIPLFSFIFLKAKCRNCKGKISWQYPLIEFFTGVVFLLVGKYFFNFMDFFGLWETVFYLIIFSLLLVLLAYDWQYLEVPIMIFWIILGFLGINFIVVSILEINMGLGLRNLTLVPSLIGGFVSWLFFFSLVFFSKEKWMGWGDVYVGLLVGLILGWPSIFLGLLLSFLMGSIYSLIIILRKKGSMKSQIPFIPFLVLGIFLTIFISREFPLVISYLVF